MTTTPNADSVPGKFLITIQAWVDTEDAVEAENIAIGIANYTEEANENPDAAPNVIQTCIAQKAPFRPLINPPIWSGESAEADVQAAQNDSPEEGR
jgi:hypothetical protein